jgi:general secretion pathway protein D
VVRMFGPAAILTAVIVALAVFTVSGCADIGVAVPDFQIPQSHSIAANPGAETVTPGDSLDLSRKPVAHKPPEVVLGANTQQPAQSRASPSVTEERGEYTLNFENTDVHDVVKAVLGDVLKLNYTIDSAVQGSITIHTSRPLPKDAVLPMLEAALQPAGVALIPHGQAYEVTPAQEALHRAGFGSSAAGTSTPGFHVEVVPLKFVGAADIQRMLEPLTQTGTTVHVDPQRNIVILSGTDAEIATLKDLIAAFDVDWLRSQSFALYTLSYSQARSIAAELGQVIGNQSPLAGFVRIIPLERLNAILVVSKQRSYLDEIHGWIDRLDRGGGNDQPRLYVYYVQNGRATDLTKVLEKIFGQGGAGSSSTRTEDTPALPSLPPLASSAADATTTLSTGIPAPGGAGRAPAAAAPVASADAGVSTVALGDTRITADDTKNALIIMATPERYHLIETALHQLDTVPLQVLLEAAVIEVTLTKSLQYGVEYFLKNGEASLLQSTVAASSLGLTPGGFSFLFSHGTNISALINLLSTVSTVRVMSSPQVMVLNNRSASIQVGDEVPVATASAVSVQSAGAPVVNSIEMENTGIILRVTPRVNRGGMVSMDIGQEVSSSVPTTSSSIDSPTIQQRRVTSSVAVQDGQTIAIGGLISDNRTSTRTGIPWLGDLPVVGPLFATNQHDLTRTEILVLITPHVVRDQKSAQDATEELKSKLPLIQSRDNQ